MSIKTDKIQTIEDGFSDTEESLVEENTLRMWPGGSCTFRKNTLKLVERN